MVTQISIAAFLWLLVTVVSPGKVRVFISALSAGLIAILLFFSLMKPGALVVSVPGYQGQEPYELPFSDFQALAAPKEIGTTIEIPNIADLKNLSKSILSVKDLSSEQLKSLEGSDGYEDFAAGETGVIIRYVAPSVENGKLRSGYDAVEFAPLPHFDELQRKQNVLDAIRDVVGERGSPQI